MFELAPGTVYVWSVPATTSAGTLSSLQQVISKDERERAARFRFDHLKQSFVVARGTLRTLLGSYLDISPAAVQFTYNCNGKPALATHPDLRFNASHSAGLAVFAFTTDCEIGVDVEQMLPLPDLLDTSKRFFCPEEAAALAALPAEQRTKAFYLCWTRKEAYLKATGEGLSAPLDSCRVNFDFDQPARFLHLPDDTENWTLRDLQLAPGFAAAVAYKDRERPLVTLSLSDAAELLGPQLTS